MMEKIHVSQIVVVEGKYDAIKLDSIIDGIIIPVNGFSVYKDSEKKELLKTLGRENGIILITDSDYAGFKIRNYLQNICRDSQITNVYVPRIQGKESRKDKPSKEGLLGVEGIDREIILKCLKDAGVSTGETVRKSDMTYADLYELGLSGGENSAKIREKLMKSLNIPNRLSKKAMLEVLNRMTTKEKIIHILNNQGDEK